MFSIKGIMFLWVMMGICTAQAKPLEIDVSAESAILINAETGAILYEKNSHTPHYPGSTTKIATALYALNQIGNDLDELIEVEQEAIASLSPAKKKKDNYRNPSHWIEVGSNHISIKKGEVMPIRALLYGMMLVSANDASNVVAQYIGGTIPAFTNQLNEYLKQIGCHETNFTNPHGLHHPDHQTTASDLAKIAREAMKNAFFRELVSTVSYLIPETNKQAARRILLTNRLLRKNHSGYYNRALGIKRGYTTDSLHTLVAAAEQNGRLLIAVVLRCLEQKDIYRDVTHMFVTAFNEPKVTKRFLKAGPQPHRLQLPGASSELQTCLANDVVFSFYPSEEPQVRAVLKWDKLSLPIAKDQRVGWITIHSSDGSFKKTVELLAKDEVVPTLIYSFKQKMSRCGKNKLVVNTVLALGIVLVFSGAAFWVMANKRKVAFH